MIFFMGNIFNGVGLSKLLEKFVVNFCNMELINFGFF